MPSGTALVGPLALPVPAGVLNSAIEDPTLVGLADYLRFWLRDGLNAKLANLQGTSADALPAANVFLWNPSTYFVRGREDGAGDEGSPIASPFPSLYVWWEGKSRRTRKSTILTLRERDIRVAYMFDELVLPGALQDRYGLLGIVDALFWKAGDWGYHPAYGYNGSPAGTSLASSLGFGRFEMSYQGGEQGVMSAIPGASQASGRSPDGHVLRAYPALNGTFNVMELVALPSLIDPDDVTTDILATLRTNGDGDANDTVEIRQAFLPRPDGSEQP